MYTTINGIYDNGQIILEETPPTEKKMKVLITFVEESNNNSPNETTVKALQAAEQGEYEVVGLNELKQQWIDA
ncbi:MAG: hypothetical protein Q7U57_08180 [Methylovulum sp.]|nr:hypothetical protein [Methylovulum sp.]